MPTRIPKPPTALTRDPHVRDIFAPLIERVARIVAPYLEKKKQPERKTA